MNYLLRTAKQQKKYKRFYAKKSWKTLRTNLFYMFGKQCMCCGATPEEGAKIHADHIVARSKDTSLELCFDNLQVLCMVCGNKKSNIHSTDYRSEEQKLYAKKYMVLHPLVRPKKMELDKVELKRTEWTWYFGKKIRFDDLVEFAQTKRSKLDKIYTHNEDT